MENNNKIVLNIMGNPTIVSQLFSVIAWINNCSGHKGISEFKIRIDNSNRDFDLKMEFNDLILNEQLKKYEESYSSYNTQTINPIFHLGIPYGIINKDTKAIKEMIDKKYK